MVWKSKKIKAAKELRITMLKQTATRIEQDLEYMKRFTATPGKGCTRLPFTKEAKEAAAYLQERMRQAGLSVKVDAAGNVLGTLHGADAAAPCVMMGSHYDSVVNGGDYDGIAGVICAIELADLLRRQKVQLKRDLVIVAFCDEEGMRFGTGYFGSGALWGQRDIAYLKGHTDANGVTVYAAMQAYGLEPEEIEEAKLPAGRIGCFLEIHIEQGPVLEAEDAELGIVEAIVGIRRLSVSVCGQADHAGAAPMHMRKDAVEAASKVIAQIPGFARACGDGSVATVGCITVEPGGVNIVAEKVGFSVDMRSKSKESIEKMQAQVMDSLQNAEKQTGCSCKVTETLRVEPVFLDEELIDTLGEYCRKKQYRYRLLVSCAGHDSLLMGQYVPTAMLFVPSCGGRSHCPEEYTESAALAKAVSVMKELTVQLLTQDEPAQRTGKCVDDDV